MCPSEWVHSKNKYIRTFKKEIYYAGLDVVEVDGKK
jgi:hypothetical protein